MPGSSPALLDKKPQRGVRTQPKNDPKKVRPTPLYVSKQRELAISDGDLGKFHVIEIK
jgi:hypothetical protein